MFGNKIKKGLPIFFILASMTPQRVISMEQHQEKNQLSAEYKKIVDYFHHNPRQREVWLSNYFDNADKLKKRLNGAGFTRENAVELGMKKLLTKLSSFKFELLDILTVAVIEAEYGNNNKNVSGYIFKYPTTDKKHYDITLMSFIENILNTIEKSDDESLIKTTQELLNSSYDSAQIRKFGPMTGILFYDQDKLKKGELNDIDFQFIEGGWVPDNVESTKNDYCSIWNHTEIEPELIDFVLSNKKVHILDIGAGTGPVLQALLKYQDQSASGIEYTAVELSKEHKKLLRERYEENNKNKNNKLIISSYDNIVDYFKNEKPENHFEAICAFNVFQFIKPSDLIFTLQHIFTSLKENGRAFFTIPSLHGGATFSEEEKRTDVLVRLLELKNKGELWPGYKAFYKKLSQENMQNFASVQRFNELAQAVGFKVIKMNLYEDIDIPLGSMKPQSIPASVGCILEKNSEAKPDEKMIKKFLKRALEIESGNLEIEVEEKNIEQEEKQDKKKLSSAEMYSVITNKLASDSTLRSKINNREEVKNNLQLFATAVEKKGGKSKATETGLIKFTKELSDYIVVKALLQNPHFILGVAALQAEYGDPKNPFASQSNEGPHVLFVYKTNQGKDVVVTSFSLLHELAKVADKDKYDAAMLKAMNVLTEQMQKEE